MYPYDNKKNFHSNFHFNPYVFPYNQYPANYDRFYPYRTNPPVDPKLLMDSAKQMKFIMSDALRVVDKISNSKKFSYDLMNAAQESKTEVVKSLIQSTGVNGMPSFKFNPDGLHLLFEGKVDNVDCCHLILQLRWM
ncbi:hypothetical protein PB1_10117 [Bacillus methanolicus PB1]|uniref:Uncharacterized protein n=1 Tax=Bacillus methanolicus PB1 TaxID=997296 RepID=I3E2I5_BACMT|nr:hypothetical protein [Bacillus methanolicus]EIJ80706.1 hypothetical protein PB1_10117 [Bacillus methanolicus PB1]